MSVTDPMRRINMSREHTFNELMDTLYGTSRLINAYESIPRTYGTDDKLYMVEVHTLDLIGRKQKTTISEIAARTDRTVSAVSQIVNKLVAKVLIHKYRNENNHREFLLELTATGEIVYNYHKNLDNIEYRKHLENLHMFNEDDFKNFIEIAQKINKRTKLVIEGKEALG